MKPCLALTALAGLGLVACVDDGDATVVIIQNQSPDEGCSVPAAPGDSYIGAGRYDIALGIGDGYLLTPVATNQAESPDTGGIDRTAFVTGIRVDLSFPAEEGLE